MAAAAPIPVAAAVLRAPDGRILVQRRPAHRDQGGLWEFPGGKIEPGESAAAALRRELREELGVDAEPGAPLIRVPWDYGDKRVVLHVLEIARYAGEPRGLEGQAVAWQAPAALDGLAWPAANRPIVRAVQLPGHYLVTPSEPQDPEAWLALLEGALAGGVRLVQMRRPDLGAAAWLRLAERLGGLCRAHGTRLLLNADPALAARVEADGLHLNRRRLAALAERPQGAAWVGASCHDAAELARAAALGADFAVLSPVRRTPSHPGRAPLGWAAFAALAAEAPLPVYALGGVGAAEAATARRHGGQGVAAIRGLLGGAA